MVNVGYLLCLDFFKFYFVEIVASTLFIRLMLKCDQDREQTQSVPFFSFTAKLREGIMKIFFWAKTQAILFHCSTRMQNMILKER